MARSESAATSEGLTAAAAIQVVSGGLAVRGAPLSVGITHGPPRCISRTVSTTRFSLPLENSSQSSVGEMPAKKTAAMAIAFNVNRSADDRLGCSRRSAMTLADCVHLHIG